MGVYCQVFHPKHCRKLTGRVTEYILARNNPMVLSLTKWIPQKTSEGSRYLKILVMILRLSHFSFVFNQYWYLYALLHHSKSWINMTIRKWQRCTNRTANYVTLDIVFLLVRMTYDVENIPSLIRALDSNKRYHGNDETDTFSSSIFFFQ